MSVDFLQSMKFSFVKAMILSADRFSELRDKNALERKHIGTISCFFHASYSDVKKTSLPGVKILKTAFMALQSHPQNTVT